MKNDQSPKQKIKTTLDQQGIDDATKRSLKAARLNALDQGNRSARPNWLAAPALAGVVMVISGVLFFGVTNDSGFPDAEAEDLALIASEDELELFEELEFYAWLDDEAV